MNDLQFTVFKGSTSTFQSRTKCMQIKIRARKIIVFDFVHVEMQSALFQIDQIRRIVIIRFLNLVNVP